MERWSDQGIVLSLRPHGESGGILSLLTEQHGRHAGYVRGVHSAKMRGLLQRGNLLSVQWDARTSDNLGGYRVEQERHMSGGLMDDPLKLGALLAACSLCDAALPEREGHPGLFHGFYALLDLLNNTAEWGAAYVMWELALLRELGFGIDLSRCAGGGDSAGLVYVSPKSGRAVSAAAGAPYKEKLLPLPGFLQPRGGSGAAPEVLAGLEMTGYFLRHWVFAHNSRGIPEERLRFEQRFVKYVEQLTMSVGEPTAEIYNGTQ